VITWETGHYRTTVRDRTGKGVVQNVNGLREPAPPDHEHEFQAIAEWLGDLPTTVISRHFMREGLAEVFCVGSPHAPEGVVIQIASYPEEPTAFGEADAIASVLPELSGWTSINVPADIADALIEPVRVATGATTVRTLDDIYFALTDPVPEITLPDVRLLTPDDRHTLDSAPPELIGGNTDVLLGEMAWGHVAGAIREGRLVSIAHTFARSDRHADIGVVTIEARRRQGLATAAAAEVARAIQRDGKIPVWSCGGTNTASLAIAARLGFHEVDRRTYLVPRLDDERTR
ncbi:MAG TPA: GNAT family N-acetyltransferase, partial [Thermomicrobiales bacterium]|nr:GNAT family N-acetyltransferase [Thermomicrobiales bacterium]